MSFNWSKFNDPVFIADLERKKAEQKEREDQRAAWSEITVGATGHRSEKMGGYYNALGGYNRNAPLVIELRQATLNVMEDLIVNQNMTRFISGGALGFDTLFFWCVNHLKVKYPHIENIIAVPFINQWTAWVKSLPLAVEWYHKMLETADYVIDVARQPDYETQEDRGERPLSLDNYSTKKMFKRNEYMVDQSKYLIAFFDGSNSGTGQCIRYAQKGYKTRPTIVRLDPRFSCKPEYF